MKTKVYLSLALLGTMLVGCTSNDFIGDDNSPDGSSNFAAIKFGGNANRMTRATANTGTAAEMLDGHFKVYGVKGGTTFSDVFQNYVVWSNANTTTSNPDGDWEYVGGTTQTYGAANTTLSAAQTIKYWDYSTTDRQQLTSRLRWKMMKMMMLGPWVISSLQLSLVSAAISMLILAQLLSQPLCILPHL